MPFGYGIQQGQWARAIVLGVAVAVTSGVASAQTVLPLREGWQIQSSAKATEEGATISTPDYKADGWIAASVPSTVVGTLVTAKLLPDPYYGRNLRDIPGVTYPEARNFSHYPMSLQSPYAVPWWYRRAFDIPASDRGAGRHVWLRFDGINFRANIWFNGTLIAKQDEVAGTFRTYEFEVTKLARATGNVIAVQISAPDVKDLALTWVDWNPMPPDKNMGLYQPVSVVTSGPVALRGPQVTSRVAPTLDKARLTVQVEASNPGDQEQLVVVRGKIEGASFERKLWLNPGETRLVEFDPDAYPQLIFPNPRLWWPYQLGPHSLYELSLEAVVDNAVADRQKVPFGIREVTSSLDEKGARLFRVNGVPVLVRGGGWASDMMLRPDPERLEVEMRYVKEMNLNTVRLEGKPETDDFYAIADREGILVMTGWCCCDQWEEWKKWTPENRWVATDSLRSQLRRLRNHPSVLAWLNASDRLPSIEVERAYLDVEREVRWSVPVVSSAANVTSTTTGKSGVKMNGPYDYVPPTYWYVDKDKGGAFGFATEISPGPAIPPIESLKEFIPAEELWPIGRYWLFHAGGQQFKNVDRFNHAMEERYGKAKDLRDYVWKAEAMAYEGERAMFEAYGRNKYRSTGVIQWMLNNAWPSIIWHLYDYSLRPAAGFFATKKACEPLHVQYSYDDRSVVVVNEYRTPFAGLRVTATVYDLDWKERFTKTETVTVAEQGVAHVTTLPEPAELPVTYFLRLALTGADGRVLSRNFYWLSTTPEVLDTAKAEWFWTPTKSLSDLTAVAELGAATVSVHAEGATSAAQEPAVLVHVTNESDRPALLVRLRLLEGKGGAEIKPVYWEDNYFELAPRESKDVRVSYPVREVRQPPTVAVDGWNVKSAD
jgi:exo-1,4-beta-D-glucosaminidase